MNSITLGDVSDFFTWRLDQEWGEGERRLRGIKEVSSLATYWKRLLGAYRRLIRKDVDSEIAKNTHNVRSLHSLSIERFLKEKKYFVRQVQLAQDHGLSRTPREKSPKDAHEVLEIS
tara:strand:+ start:589 stop:939 length:351 start_codon:yes stop_codon:yes gene_type:complete